MNTFQCDETFYATSKLEMSIPCKHTCIHKQMCTNVACMHAAAHVPHACAYAHAHACRQLRIHNYYFLPCTASSISSFI